MQKRIADLKAGDIVKAHGGTFRILANARESSSHRPQAAHLTTAHGPADCAWAKGECLEGKVSGYFWPGSEWTFQGSAAVTVQVI